MSQNYGKIFLYQPEIPLFQSATIINIKFSDLCLLKDKRILIILDKAIIKLNQKTLKEIITYNEKEDKIKNNFKNILNFNSYESNNIKYEDIIIFNSNEIFLYSISIINQINFIDKIDIKERIGKIKCFKLNILILSNNKTLIYKLFNKKFRFIKEISFQNEIIDIIQINDNDILIYLKKEQLLLLYNIIEEKEKNRLIVKHHGKYYNKFGMMKLINDKTLLIVIGNDLILVDINKMKKIYGLYYFELPKNLREKSSSFNRYYRIAKTKENNMTIKSIIKMKGSNYLGMSGKGHCFIVFNLYDSNYSFLNSNYYKTIDFNYMIKMSQKSFLCFKRPDKIAIFNII